MLGSALVYIDRYLFIKFASRLGLARSRASWPAWLEMLLFARNGRSSLPGSAGALKCGARVRSASLGRSTALDSAAQAHSDEETCEKPIRRRCARVATRSEHLALVVYGSSMDMLGSALVYIYIYILERTRANPCSEYRRAEPGVQSESRPEHSVFG